MRKWIPEWSGNFDEEKADRAVRFIETYLRHTKGRWAGANFVLAPWQREPIRHIFGRVDSNGNRVIRQVYWEVPKKNGKSEVAAGIATKLLFADNEPAAEVYSAACDKDQASIVFNVVASMIRKDRRLASRCHVVDHSKRVMVPATESVYRVLSADVAGKHGYSVHGCIFDEVHAQPDRSLWEVLTFGAGDARTQPLTFAITTAGIPGESPVAEELHDDAVQILSGVVEPSPTFFPVVYSAPTDTPWDNEEVWYDCNPALGDFLSVDSVREACQQAKRRPSEQNSFRRFRLNQWVKQEQRWIDVNEWDSCKSHVTIRDLKDRTAYLGMDLSSTSDITAICADVVLDGTHHLLHWFWLPESAVEEGRHRERERYRDWAKRGFLELIPGNVIDYEYIRAKIKEIGSVLRIKEIGYDPYNAMDLCTRLQSDGFEMVKIGQSYGYMSSPSKEFERLILSRKLSHTGNPVMRWMIDNVAISSDHIGNIKPVRPDRAKSTKKIDGVIASILATDCAIRNAGKARSSVYESRGVLVF